MTELIFPNPQILFATIQDLREILQLLNTAYRGNASKKGWTTEADLIAGEFRTNEENLRQTMELKNSVFLLFKDAESKIVGCVNLQEKENRLYLGMFSVYPELQGAGIGKALLYAAEHYARHCNCKAIFMTVISIRTELIAWYQRHGYAITGESLPFTEDGISGKHLQPLEFCVLEKNL